MRQRVRQWRAARAVWTQDDVEVGAVRTAGRMISPACWLFVLVVVALSPSVGDGIAQEKSGDTIDHGPNGTLNLDYFEGVSSPGTHLHWLLADQRRAHLDKALREIRSGQYRAAYADLDFLLRRFVNHPEGLQAMVLVGNLMRQPSMALPHFDRALRTYPQYGATHAQYGLYLSKLGRRAEAVKALEEAIKLDPKLAVAHAWLSDVYAELGEATLARGAAQRARDLGFKGGP